MGVHNSGPYAFASTTSVLNQSQDILSNQKSTTITKPQLLNTSSEMPTINKRYQRPNQLKQQQSCCNPSDNPITYNQLNEKLMFPNNPAYFKI